MARISLKEDDISIDVEVDTADLIEALWGICELLKQVDFVRGHIIDGTLGIGLAVRKEG